MTGLIYFSVHIGETWLYITFVAGERQLVPSFVSLKDIEEKATEIYLSKSDYIDDTNIRL